MRKVFSKIWEDIKANWSLYVFYIGLIMLCGNVLHTDYRLWKIEQLNYSIEYSQSAK